MVQITCIVLFSSSNILITQCLGPEYVRSYDVVFKVFSVITIAHGLILSPLWSAYTDAYVKRDFNWLKNSLKKTIYLMIPIIICVFIIIWQIDFIISFWLRTTINIPEYLPICMGLYVIVLCWDNVWSYFVNGVGKISIQLYSKIISVIIILPLSWYLMSKIGSTGMCLALAIGLFISSIPTMIQVRYILKDK